MQNTAPTTLKQALANLGLSTLLHIEDASNGVTKAFLLMAPLDDTGDSIDFDKALSNTGRNKFPNVKASRIKKTHGYLYNNKTFMTCLSLAIRSVQTKAINNNKRVVVVIPSFINTNKLKTEFPTITFEAIQEI